MKKSVHTGLLSLPIAVALLAWPAAALATPPANDPFGSPVVPLAF